MTTLVPWVENNISTLIARKVPTTDGAPKWCTIKIVDYRRRGLALDTDSRESRQITSGWNRADGS
jgi:hypothetical protein